MTSLNVIDAAAEETGTSAINDWMPGEFALRDTWFAAAHVSQVGIRPIRRLIHSRRCFLWRDGTGFRAAEFHPQRRTDKHERASEFTAGTGAYPVALAYGFVWVWYGNPANASPDLIPRVPFIPRDRAVAEHLRGSYFFACTKDLMCENVLDLTHLNFIHRKAAGFDEAESDRVSVESSSETVTMIRETKRQRTPEFQRNFAGVTADHQDAIAIVHMFLRSGVCLLSTQFDPGTASMPLLQGLVPESKTRTLMNYAYSPSDVTPEIYSREWPKHAPVVVQQDDSMLYPQNPRYQRRSARADCHTRFDAADVAFRTRMKQLVERQRRGDFSYLADGDPGADITDKMRLKDSYSAKAGAPMVERTN
jgi:phenylpropionate dioxygenase-like ring-hydroxylating dioxygenase large terminal subunit